MKIHSFKSIAIRIGALLCFASMISACASVDISRQGSIPENSKLLIIPPHDVTQNAVAHPKGKGSGEYLQNSVKSELLKITKYDVLLINSNKEFNHISDIDENSALKEAARLNAEYCLILALGEFRNAAPMTFRSDFVTLNSGKLIEVKTKKIIWQVNKPIRLEKTNIGNHLALIDQLARIVAESISKN